MPRIAAASIEQHVRNQEKRILASARRLFMEKGYRKTDLGEIARSMGLARNSIYRYYRSKDHILVAVLEHEMTPFVEQLQDLAESIKDPLSRIDAWVGLQIELAAGPCLTMMNMLGDIPSSARDLNRQIEAMHEPSQRVLWDAVTELLSGTGRDPQLVSTMIGSMVQSAASVAMRRGSVSDCVVELRHSIRRIVAAD